MESKKELTLKEKNAIIKANTKAKKLKQKGVRVTTQTDNRVQRMPIINDNLKYFRVIKYYTQRKYNIKGPELDMLLFLYSEPLFMKSDFSRFSEIFPWDRNRFKKMVEDNWIHIWRKGIGKEADLYEITRSAKVLVTALYKQLEGSRPLSVSPKYNPMFGDEKSFADKMYVRAIENMNKDIIELKRHLVPRSSERLGRKS
jgi:hypothetical protein